MSNPTTLRAVLGSQTDDKSVHGQALLKVIQGAPTQEERAELLGIALTERDSVPKTPKVLPNKGIPDDEWDQLVKTHSGMINGHLKMAFFKTENVKGFAAEILRLIDFVSEEHEKTFVLTKSLYSPYVPYQELPGKPVHMTQREYVHKLESDERRVKLINYIQELPFDERTERASLLLQVIDDTTDRDLRVALLAHANFKLEEKVAKRVARAMEND